MRHGGFLFRNILMKLNRNPYLSQPQLQLDRLPRSSDRQLCQLPRPSFPTKYVSVAAYEARVHERIHGH